MLILRIDKGLSWRDLALVMNDEAGVSDGAELDREAARLRKRFQIAKERLRELARARGADGVTAAGPSCDTRRAFSPGAGSGRERPTCDVPKTH